MLRICLIIAIVAGLAAGAVSFFKVQDIITTTRQARDEWNGKYTNEFAAHTKTKATLKKTADSYFLVATDEPIDNPDVFDFEGARTRGGVHPAYADPLTAMLSEVGAPTRAPKPRQVPAQWSIESVTIRSVPAKP